MASTPLFNPEDFFRERPDPSLLLPTVVVLGSGLIPLTILFAYVVGGDVVNALNLPPVPSAVQEQEFLWITVALLTVGSVIAWWIDTGIMYLISASESGSYDRLLAYVGWGYLPLILQIIIELIVSALLGVIGVTNPVPLLYDGFTILFVAWTGYIWVFAVKIGRNVTFSRAFLAALIPALFHLRALY